MPYAVDIKQYQSNTLSDGVHAAKVIDAYEDTSKSGNEMLVMELEVYDVGRGSKCKIKDYLVYTEKAAWKIANLLESLGKKGKAEVSKELVQGKTLYIKTKTNDRDYPAVQRYLSKTEYENETAQQQMDFDNENIPF
jgi:hypothetical protein